jgi:hypothetical protein
MVALLCFVLAVLAPPFKSKSRLEAENAALRHQLIVLRRKVHGRVWLTDSDRWFLIQLYRWFPSILRVLTIDQPETLVRWHRAGFRRYWRWKSRPRGGRPQIAADLRALIQRMSIENPLWGAPRIHGELLKLGFEVTQSSVAKYMVKRRGPPIAGALISMMARSATRSHQRPDTLMQDRSPPAQQNPHATHGRTIHWVIHADFAMSAACPLSPRKRPEDIAEGPSRAEAVRFSLDVRYRCAPKR